MSRAYVNELDPELLGVAALNPFLMHDSSSRLQMFCTHIGQALTIKDPDVPRILSGVEREYARYTHSIKMPCNAIIIKCIHKYPRTLGMDNIIDNPLITVIYENADSPHREIGILDLTKYYCSHQYFGFKYQYRPAAAKLVPGAHIQKGTIIADSPSVTEDGDYKYGIEAQIALMSMPGAIEDGVIVAESFLKRMTTTAFGSRIESWGKNRYPLNLYGDETHYKPFPDIGERIRPDGLLFATRQYDEALAVVNMMGKSLRTPNEFDRTTYAIPNARVVDVIVHRGRSNKINLPQGMDAQTHFYHSKTQTYYESLLMEYQNIKRKRKDNMHLTPEFSRLLVEARAMVNEDPRNRVQHMFNRTPIDEWHVEVIFEYEIVPTIGFKMTDKNGA